MEIYYNIIIGYRIFKNSFSCRKVGHVQFSSNFFILLSGARSEHAFFKKNQQKRKYHKEEKQDFERFLILLNIKMPAKSKKN